MNIKRILISHSREQFQGLNCIFLLIYHGRRDNLCSSVRDGVENPCCLVWYGIGFPSLGIQPIWPCVINKNGISLGKPMPSLSQMGSVLHPTRGSNKTVGWSECNGCTVQVSCRLKPDQERGHWNTEYRLVSWFSITIARLVTI